MNEHMWKKLGEVKAFAGACADFLDRGREGFTSADIFSDDELDQLIKKNQSHLKRIDKIAAEADESETVNTKAEATAGKLIDMQDRYLTDEDDWKDGMELLEWSGFFFGGAVVHWNLMRGASEAAHNADFIALADGGTNFHTQILETVTESIHELAKEESADA